MRILLTIAISLLALVVYADSTDSPVGLWETFDEDGQLQSTVEVRIANDRLLANIVRLHNSDDKNPMCDKCQGDLHGKPVIGMQIFDGLTLKKGIWQKGAVFDPETGDSYKGKVWLNGGKLYVRGYIGFLYKTRVWRRTL